MIKSTVAALVVLALVGTAWLSGAFGPSDHAAKAKPDTGVPVAMASCCDPELKDPTLVHSSVYNLDAVMVAATTDAPLAMSCCGDDTEKVSSCCSAEKSCCSETSAACGSGCGGEKACSEAVSACCSNGAPCCTDSDKCVTDAACGPALSCCQEDKPAAVVAVAAKSTCCGGNTEATGGPTCCGGCTSE